MARGSTDCQRMCEKVIEMFKYNVPHGQIGRDLQITLYTLHSTIKRCREFQEMHVLTAQ